MIKKMTDYKQVLATVLEDALKNVNAGNTNISEEEASVINERFS